MIERLVTIRVGVLLLVATASAAIWLPLLPVTADETTLLEVHFLDVGQGDAVLIESPSGQQMLIDGGPDNQVLRMLAREMSFIDRTIDVVLATHTDSDHIGGLIDVLQRYKVGTIITTDNTGDTATAKRFSELGSHEGAALVEARRGQVIDLGAGVIVEVLYPETSVEAYESNTSSVVVQVRYGEVEFMLTGDSPKRIEEYLVLAYGEYLESDVLKIGHHGSRTSTAEDFLTAVKPQFGVISASADNRYGHPHWEVTDALFNARVETLSTSQSGTISFLSDGNKVWVK